MNYEDWNDSAQTFESSLMILRKDKNGWVIGFSVHPNDAPTALLEAPLGTRFRAVLFQIGDDEQPVVLEEVREGKKAVAMAGEMCRNIDFQRFLWKFASTKDSYVGADESTDITEEDDYEEIAASLLRGVLGIDSRSDLNTDTEAQARFKGLMEDYRNSAFSSPEKFPF